MLFGRSEITLMVDAVVCLTLLLTVICAKCIGCTLPMLADKLGFDPAVMASPFITTLVDAVSLMIYFQLAKAMLGIV
jgi:magnesium transporter